MEGMGRITDQIDGSGTVAQPGVAELRIWKVHVTFFALKITVIAVF
jgi:hypothetical protein